MFYVYMLRCSDRTIYVGHTDDLDDRLLRHDLGKDARYTARRRPLVLIYVAEVESRHGAISLEQKLKGWSRAKKLALAAGDWAQVSRLARGRNRSESEADASTPRPSAATLSANGLGMTRPPATKRGIDAGQQGRPAVPENTV